MKYLFEFYPFEVQIFCNVPKLSCKINNIIKEDIYLKKSL